VGHKADVASISAVIQPAVPPPTTQMCFTGGGASVVPPAGRAVMCWLKTVAVSLMRLSKEKGERVVHAPL